MQEFSSISVSSYEAGTLAEQLTEQSRAGWSVVAIVPTGSTVTAYLSRIAGAGAGAASADSDATTAPAEVTNTAAVASSDAAPADEPSTATATATAAGWAAGAATETTGTATAAETTATTDPGADDHFTVAEEPVAEEPAAEATPAAMSTASSGSGAAPAGWYADPSSRFELRYWDGSQWTEHVSRAGQQYTDPPVA